ncbi:MAG: Ig-like domain-containing protein [Muribaculaceae bacterium]|nr:Ig-like domain-containing protein [Muribaculaceae bacterium]
MKTLSKYMMAVALGCLAIGASAQAKQDWGDFKLWIDPGHSGHENTGLFNYTEAQKVLRVGLATRDFLFRYTTADTTTIQMTRDDDQDYVTLDERSDMANAWGADFFYSIHSDAGSGYNTTLFLFGGWKLNGEYIEKTPNGGKRYGDILCPNLTSVMYNTGTRGNFYDRVYYNGDVDTHENQYPYLSVNRRTNMASLLSEGGFHTQATQQGLNINEDYKHLEAFGTFRSIMEYCGLERPDQVMLAGVVTNSENGQGVDGVTVTVNGETYITDTFESTFHQYVRFDNIVHNGFFLFEDLTPGETYEITYSCPGYESATQTVTMQSDPQGLAGDNVTWGNIQLTNTMPAVVSGNTVTNPDAVNTRYDMEITFSRNMDRASVEQAFSINNNGQVTLSWDNDYTLRVKLSDLMDDMFYTITIKGDIAKNSQTGQFLDGDGDGVEGGDYVFDFITIPADVEAPYITSTTPRENETHKYNQRPVIRIEYNEELDWNEDQAIDAITVEDADGNKYEGRLTHTVVREASVLQLFLNQDLPLDKCFRVTVKGGFADLAGNVNPDGKVFKFLSEYRTQKYHEQMIGEYVPSDWFATVAGSGSSKGFTEAENQFYAKRTDVVYNDTVPSTMQIHYQYDPFSDEPWWGGRCYNRTTDGASYPSSKTKLKNAVIMAMVFGDGSEQYVGHGVRWRNDEASVKRYTRQPVVRGWEMVAWDVNNEESEIVSGTETWVTDAQWKYDAFWFWKGRIPELLDENPDLLDYPASYWEGDFFLGPVYKVIFNNEEQTATLDDFNDEPAYATGDVNGDGEIDVQDVNILINILLGFDSADKYAGRAFIVNTDQVDVADVNALINIMLGQ